MLRPEQNVRAERDALRRGPWPESTCEGRASAAANLSGGRVKACDLCPRALPGNLDPAAVALRDDEASLAQLVRDHYVERIIDRAAFMAAKKHIDERIDERRSLVARAGPMSWLRDAGAVHRERERRDLTWRREMLRAWCAWSSRPPAVTDTRTG
jgi:hypothetical protein